MSPSSEARGTALQNSGGKLYVVGTPIGNLEDTTLRALRTLKEVDLIACEDTRRTQKLLNHFSISTPTVSYHEHNEITRSAELMIQLEEGTNIALVSDAGVPGISDPGYRLVHLAIRHGIPVIPVPGVSAFVAALSVAGLPVDAFRFVGFLPRKMAERRRALEGLKGAEGTLVFYEAPHRTLEMLGDVRQVLGERSVVVAREVTKIHEEFVRGSVSEVLKSLGRKPVKGELTVLVGPGANRNRNDAGSSELSVGAELERLITEHGMDERAALKAVSRARGISKSQAYRQWQLEKSLER